MRKSKKLARKRANKEKAKKRSTTNVVADEQNSENVSKSRFRVVEVDKALADKWLDEAADNRYVPYARVDAGPC